MTLRCLILVLYVGHEGTIEALLQAPAGNIVPCTLSSLRSGLKWLGWNQVTLRCLILVFLCWAWGTIGALPQAPAGNIVPCTLSSLRGGLKRLGWNQVTLRCLILVFFMLGVGGRLGLCPKPQQGTCSLHPFFASRRFKVAGMGIR